MLDPVSAIGLASAIVQFVDFGAEIIQGAREVHGTTSGAMERNRSLEVVVRQTRDLISKLNDPDYSQDTEDGKALGRVASECTIVADQMLNLLQKVKAKDSNSTLQAVWAALKNQRYRREMLELQERLDSCRDHLEFQLSYLTSAETKNRLAFLATSTEGLAEEFKIIQQHVEQLRGGTRVTLLSPQAQKQVRKLVQLSDEVLDRIKHQRVLTALAYSGMERRFAEVSEEHYRTFEWIFEDTTRANSLGRGASNQESFVHWLSAGRGIFHICGKLGSGKSTLMKFLCNHPRTEAELQHWAGDRKLVSAQFFFWRGAKTAEQKSLTGLLRSLLYETLRACPELIPDVLPDLCAQLDSVPWQQVETKLDLGKLRTRAAISSLIHHRDLYQKHCFCFFIDGLDEFENTAQDGYGDLIRLLKSWSDAAPEAVKICVSSREDLVFMDAFSPERRFRLQDLTRDDIQWYVRDKLLVVADGEGAELARKITERADGIFLWVALVVKSIRDQLDQAYEPSDVQQELDRLPSELHGLFEYLLKSISSSGRKRAHRTFAMVLKLRYYQIDLPLLAYSFLEDYERNPAFAMEASFPFWDMDDPTRASREDLARKRLYRDCRGLLEVNEDKATMTVTHRSILEFLESPTVKAEMEYSLDGFSTEDAISQLLLAELQCQKKALERGHLSRIVFVVIDMRMRRNMDRDPFRFLERFSSAVIYHDGPPKTRVKDFIFVERLDGAALVTGFYQKNPHAGSFLTSPLHISALYGGCDYALWKLQRDTTIVENALEIGTTVCCITSFWDVDSELFDKKLKLLELILLLGLSPNAVIHTCAQNSYFDGELSFWQHFILTLCDRPDEIRRGSGGMIEKFLEHDADPYMWISKCRRAPEDPGTQDPVTVTFGRERCKAVVIGPLGFYEWTPPHVEEGQEISLREVLELWKLDNEEAILRLLDRNARRREMIANVDNMALSQQPEYQEECVEQDLDLSDAPPEQELTPASTLEEAAEEPQATKLSTTRDTGPWLGLAAQTHVPSFVLGTLVGVVLSQLWTTMATQWNLSER